VDEIVLTLPRDRRWHSVAHLVVAGLAARLDLTVETLEDWQLALAELFGRQRENGTLEIAFRTWPERLEARFGPVDGKLVAELEQESEGVGLKRVLTALVDAIEVETVGNDRWLILRKGIVRPGGVS
jgi:anti-sigma regulatory factor (Ser/Thr protein kinase)